jgi:hypothetical protein
MDPPAVDRPAPPGASKEVMISSLRAAAGLSLLLVACGSQGDRSAFRPPIANPGLDATVPRGTWVTLDGSRSTDPDAHQLTYAWSLVSRPEGSQATVGATSYRGEATFLADVEGAYRARLEVSDGKNVGSDEVVLTAVNLPPVAMAGADRDVSVGVPQTLSASGTRDPNHDPITLAWTLVSQPAGSAASLSGATTSAPLLVPDQLGDYRVLLTVSDGLLEATDELLITARNHAPISDAGPDLETNDGELLPLTGLATRDPEGDPYTCRWTITGRPAGSVAALTDPTSCTPALPVDAEGTFVLSLATSDGQLEGPADTLRVTAHHRAWVLPHDLVAAEYSRSLDRVVAVGATPYRLYVIDPVARTERSVDLFYAPSSVALSPDGRRALVGNSSWATAVDLTTDPPTLGQTIHLVFTAGKVVLTDGGIGCAFPGRSDEALECFDLATGATTRSTGTTPKYGAWARLHPAGVRIYETSGIGTPASFGRLDLTGVQAAFIAAAPESATRPLCSALWFSEDGARIFSACGDVFASSDHLGTAAGDDMVLSGALTGSTGLAWVDHSAAAGRVLAITTGGPYGSAGGVLRIYGDAALDLLETSDLPRLGVAGVGYLSLGRFGFWSGDGTRRILLTLSNGRWVAWVY